MPSSMPTATKGASRNSSARSTSRRFFRPRSRPAQRSKTSIIGTQKRIGKKWASSGTPTIAAPKPVSPNTVYARTTINAAATTLASGKSGMRPGRRSGVQVHRRRIASRRVAAHPALRSASTSPIGIRLISADGVSAGSSSDDPRRLARHRQGVAAPRFVAPGDERRLGATQRLGDGLVRLHLDRADVEGDARDPRRDLAVVEAGDDARDDERRIGQAGARQDDGEVVAAEPAGDVAAAQRLAQRPCRSGAAPRRRWCGRAAR